MKLSEHTDHIRQTIERAVTNRLARLGIESKSQTTSIELDEYQKTERDRLLEVHKSLAVETGTYGKAYEKLVDELTFTLFNRIAALKVMEAHTLIPEVITQRPEHGDRSFGHSGFLERQPDKRNEEREGLVPYLKEEFEKQAGSFPLFSLNHYYHLMPTAEELKEIIDAFNAVEKDKKDIDSEIWKSDDILGWLYESYNNYKKKAHKDSKKKTEYDKVSLQSQVYTPRWVVEFLVDNSLGKLYLEMYPNSDIKNQFKIANPPTEQSRERKPLTEIKVIDPAMGSGNFLLYAFDVFYALYEDQIHNYGADYTEREIPELILKHNLYGVDLDKRAIQLAQLGLFIKAKQKRRRIKNVNYFNIVSSDFVLPEYQEVKYIFNPENTLAPELEQMVVRIWDDLRNAHKFGSLVRIEEIIEAEIEEIARRTQYNLFDEDTKSKAFLKSFIQKLKEAVAQHAMSDHPDFMHVQATNAITFMEVLTTKYDVALANPPYTSSRDFGPELKSFIDKNYQKPFKFHKNLYAVFVKRNYEITISNGKIGMIHPLTFMYIKDFSDVRKFILDKTHINLFVEYGLSDLFGDKMADPAFYVLEKDTDEKKESLFISLNQYTRTPNEKYKKKFCLEALDDYIDHKNNKHNILIHQDKLKVIETWPFIYWISDGFRKKFKSKNLDSVLFIRQGGATGDNSRTLRFWWEVDCNDISMKKGDGLKWVIFQKGGPYKKWHGNNWCLIGYNDPVQYNYLKTHGNKLPSEDKYFLEGVTYCSSGSKGTSFRFMPANQIISGAGPGVLPHKFKNNFYVLGFMNSNLSFYLAYCLNPTVNTTQGDLKRIPFVFPESKDEQIVSKLSKQNVEIEKEIVNKNIIELDYKKSQYFTQFAPFTELLIETLNIENRRKSNSIINEAIIDKKVFDIYELTENDRQQVETKMGKSIGSLPVFREAQTAYLAALEDPILEVKDYIENLEIIDFSEEQIKNIKDGFATLYNSNNDLEEFCKKHQVNPINVWYWFKEEEIIPKGRAKEIALEFVTDHIRTLLAEDDDGIIPLFNQSIEPKLFDRLLNHWYKQGFTSAQISELDGFLGKPLERYLTENFFEDLSNHLNLFMYLPKTPFIWHITSGQHKAFEILISIYQWNRDSLFRIKSVYLSKRRDQLQMRLHDLQDVDTAKALDEKETILKQLPELDEFESKIDELIAENYDPILDDGVGKNIAPLQKKGMLKYEVLTAGQLTKYLNADW